MRAWIEEDTDNEDSHLHASGESKAYICEYDNGTHKDIGYYQLHMKPKTYYIEYDEPEEEKKPVVDFIKVRVDLTGLTNSEVIELLGALNAAGFEAVFLPETKPYVYPTTPSWPGVLGTPRDPGQPFVTNVYGENPKFG